MYVEKFLWGIVQIHADILNCELLLIHSLPSFFFLQKSAGGGKKTKAKKGSSKRQTKTVPRKRQQPEKPNTRQSDQVAKAKEGTSGSSAHKGAVASTSQTSRPSSKEPTSPLQTKTKQHHEKAQKAASCFLSAISTKYNVMLACAQCFPQEADQPQLDCHACKKTTLVLQEHCTTRYIRIRPMPYQPSPDQLCENFKNNIPCDLRENCPRPHTLEEQNAWILSKHYHCTIPDFIEQLNQTSLTCHFVIRQLCNEYKGYFILCCSACKSSSPTIYTMKKRHESSCSKGHPWQPELLFEISKPDEETQLFETTREGKNKHEKIADAVQKLQDNGFEMKYIMEVSKKVSQSLKAIKRNNETVNKQEQLLNESRERYTSGSSEDYNLSTNCAELTEMIGEIPFDGDVDTPGEVGDEEDAEVRRKKYYEELPPDELKAKLKDDPDHYKECIIKLKSPHDAICQTCDPHDPVRAIKICGRMNSGPAMSGDTVVVKIVESQVLDENETVTRGRVVGVIGHHFNRKAYTFVCTVDQYQSNLMKPVCGTAPKIHVLDKAVKERFPNNEKLQEAKVAIYKKGDSGLQKDLVCDQIVDLNLKNKHDRLFAVKYIKWSCGYIYPLGYVCAVLPTGMDIQRGVNMLNLIYQLPQPLPEDEMAQDGNVHIDTSKRKDMRNLHTVSIDPQDCKDIDDALSIKMIKSNNKTKYEVTIHIADVSEQVRKGDKNDEEAKRRMTSYYPRENRTPVHMLPDCLSQIRCSLKDGKDRLAMSVTVIIKDDGSWDMKTTTIHESVMQNNARLTYRKAQDIIEGNRSGFDFDDETKMTVTMLHHIGCKLRWKRLGEALHVCDLKDPREDDGCPEAHNLIDEFMILANQAVAQYLVSCYDEEVPLRHQGKPSNEGLIAWNEFNRAVQYVSMYFQQFTQEIDSIEALASETNHGEATMPALEESPEKHQQVPIPVHTTGTKTTKPEPVLESTDPRTDGHEGCTKGKVRHVPIAKATVLEIKKALSNSNEQRARHLFCTEMLHPLHAIAMADWFEIQERAVYIHSGNVKFKERGHYSLKAKQYVQFTSPIRRYMDIVIHRLVKAKLRHEDCPYAAHEVHGLCERANRIMSRAKKYGRAIKLLEVTAVLSQNALSLPATARTIDDSGIDVCIPFLRMMKASEKMLCYSDMDVVEKPVLGDGKVKLHFKKRIYDTDPKTILARTKAQSKTRMELNPTSHVCHVPENDWKDLQQTICDRPEDFRGIAERALIPLLNKMPPAQTISDISSEMSNNKPIIYHHADFGICVEKAGVVQVQLSTRNIQGLMSPTISLMNLTPHLDICLEHSKEPVACFAEIATSFTKKSYHSLEEYQEIWKPLISMESAQAAVKDGEPIIIHNVHISMHKSNDAFYGFFELTKQFCFTRHIKMLRNSKGEDEDSNDYLCLRIPIQKSDKTGIQYRSPNVWMAHAVATFVTETTDEAVKLEFKLQRFSSPPPDDMLTENRKGNRSNLVSGTVEILPKPLPFR